MSFRDRLYAAALCVSAALVVSGVVLVYVPAGLVVAGLLSALLAFLLLTDDAPNVEAG